MKRFDSSYTDSSYIKTSMTQYIPEEGFITIQEKSFSSISDKFFLSFKGYQLQITAFNQYGFTINGKIKAIGPIVIFPKTIYSWNVEDHNEINEKSLSIFNLLDPKIDILIIGTGDKYSKTDPELPKWLIKNKITNFEILQTVMANSNIYFTSS